MSHLISVHPQNPQPRLLAKAAQLVHEGGIAALPTDSSYALICHLDDKAAAEQLRRLRGVDDKHHLTLLCLDLAQIAQYAKVDNAQYRLLKANTPGGYTFILEATKEVPRRVSHPQRKTIGLRVSDHVVTRAFLSSFGGAVLSTTLIPPDEEDPLNDPEQILQRMGHALACIVDGGDVVNAPTTVVDLSRGGAEVLRVGRGDPTPFMG